MAMSLAQVEAFVAVADHGGFRRAADRLNTTQPSISARVAALEERLGQRLFDRDAGSVRLTGPGRRLLPAARALLAAADDLVAAAGDDSLHDGVLRLGVAELVAQTWLSRFLREMQDRFPNVAVELTVDLSARLSEALDRREIDLAFQNGPFDRVATGSVPLCVHPHVWVASPALAAGPMAGHRILTHPRGSVPHRDLTARFGGTEVRLVPAANAGTIRRMALDGLGRACLPEPMVREDIAGGGLVALDHDWLPDPLDYHARFDAGTATAPLRAAVEIAVTCAADDQEIGSS